MKKLVTQNITRKEYNYTLGICNLRFTLRNDNTDELIPYKQLMLQGLADIEADIKMIQSKRKK